MRNACSLLMVSVLAVAAACGTEGSSEFGSGDKELTSGEAGGPGGFGNTPGGPGDGGGGGDAANCSPNLTGLVRDFRGKDATDGHPDFQAFENDQPTTGLVEATLGTDRKPVFKSTQGDGSKDQLTSAAAFDPWYRDTPGTNETFPYELALVPGDNGVLTFSSNAFFPIDGRGFGNSGKDASDVEHNFHFTFELHLEFRYQGGETFKFTGDDDLWTFINGKLAIDLGGLHPARDAEITLDDRAAELGIEKGKVYAIDIFHAERRTNASNFRIDTTLDFVNCNAILLPR